MASLVTCSFCTTTRLSAVRSTTATGSSRRHQQVRSTTTVAQQTSRSCSNNNQNLCAHHHSNNSTSSLLLSPQQLAAPLLSTTTSSCYSTNAPRTKSTTTTTTTLAKKNPILPATTLLSSSSSPPRLLSSQATSAISLVGSSDGNPSTSSTLLGRRGGGWTTNELLASAIFAVTATACTMLYNAPSSSNINTNNDNTAASLSSARATASAATAAAMPSSSAANNTAPFATSTAATNATATLTSPSLHAPHILIGPSPRRSVGGNSGGGGGTGSGGPSGSGGGSGKGGPSSSDSSSFSKIGSKTDSSNQGNNKESTSSTKHNTTPKSYDVSIRALKGQREYMEDEYYVTNGGRFVGVFDGHGGSGVSSYLRENLHKLINEQLTIKHWEETDEILTDTVAAAATTGGGVGDTEQHNNNNDSQQQSSSTNRGGFMNTSSKSKSKKQATNNPSATTLSRTKSKPSISSYVGAIRSSFEIIDHDILMNDRLQNIGSTAVVVVVHEGDDGHRTLLSANVGDSRAILCRRGQAVDLTRDHKPNDDREKARILAMGEIIEWDYYANVHRIRNLSLSRAIGDRFAKPAVSGEVEIKHFPVAEDGDEYILLASDGVWDVMSSQDVVDFVQEKMDDMTIPSNPSFSDEDMDRYKFTRRKNMSRYVANEALRRGSGDNICVVMVWLQDLSFKPYE